MRLNVSFLLTIKIGFLKVILNIRRRIYVVKILNCLEIEKNDYVILVKFFILFLKIYNKIYNW